MLDIMLSIANAFFPLNVESGSMANNLADHSKYACLINLICKVNIINLCK
jgi:hypothetical protein